MTAPWTTPGQRWRLLAPTGAMAVSVPPGLRPVRRTAAELRALPAGTPVVLLDHRRGGRRRARRIAATGAIVVDREYVALPSLRRAILLVEDTADALRWACHSLLSPPPGVTWTHAPIHTAIALLRRRPGAAAALAAGRVVVGRTP
ncbi:MAG TPA: hypothetical protein VGH77_17720 [Streptosporangiaceae bacterium]